MTGKRRSITPRAASCEPTSFTPCYFSAAPPAPLRLQPGVATPGGFNPYRRHAESPPRRKILPGVCPGAGVAGPGRGGDNQRSNRHERHGAIEPSPLYGKEMQRLPRLRSTGRPERSTGAALLHLSPCNYPGRIRTRSGGGRRLPCLPRAAHFAARKPSHRRPEGDLRLVSSRSTTIPEDARQRRGAPHELRRLPRPPCRRE